MIIFWNSDFERRFLHIYINLEKVPHYLLNVYYIVKLFC